MYSRSKSNALLCSLARSIGRLVSFHFLSLRAHSTARHGTHNLQIQTNRTLDTIEQTGLEQKQPAKLRTAPKLTLFPSSSLSNALLPKGKAAFSHCILGNSVKICAGNQCPANIRFFFLSLHAGKNLGTNFMKLDSYFAETNVLTLGYLRETFRGLQSWTETFQRGVPICFKLSSLS